MKKGSKAYQKLVNVISSFKILFCFLHIFGNVISIMFDIASKDFSKERTETFLLLDNYFFRIFLKIFFLHENKIRQL